MAISSSNSRWRASAPSASGVARTLFVFVVGFSVVARVATASEQSELLYSRGLVDFHAGRYSDALTLFDQAVNADANDVDARYYRGVTEGRLGNYQAAASDLRTVLAAKPDLDQGALELGVALVQTGEYADAVPYLEQAQRVGTLDAEASFFLGIAQLRLGQTDTARQNFERAAARDPELALASRYYLGVVEYQGKNWPRAQEHFNYVATTSPSSEMGQQAQAFLGQLRAGVQPGAPTAFKPYQLYGRVGLEYDSNVALAPSDEALNAAGATISRRDDGRFTILVGGTYAPVHTDRVQLSVGYEFFQSLHFDLTEFNLQDHRPNMQITVAAGPVQLGLYGAYDYYLLDMESFLQQGTAIPSVTVPEDQFGRTEVFFRLRRRDFFNGHFGGELSTFKPSGVLDSFNYAPGIRQFVYLGAPTNYVYLGYRFVREDPINHQGNAFAYDGQEGDTGVGWALPWNIGAELDYAYRYEDYAHQSAITFPPHGRIDNVHQIAVAADKPLTDHLDLTLGYLGTINDSNDDLFNYDRHIVSLSLGARF